MWEPTNIWSVIEVFPPFLSVSCVVYPFDPWDTQGRRSGGDSLVGTREEESDFKTQVLLLYHSADCGLGRLYIDSTTCGHILTIWKQTVGQDRTKHHKPVED